MSFKKILVPYDGSEHAQSALAIAKDLLSDDLDATLYVISVVPIASMPPALNLRSDPFAGSSATFVDYQEYNSLVHDALQSAHQELCEDISTFLEDVDNTVIEAIPNESIANGITEYAEEHSCDIIVMGRRGLGALRGMLGSVSYAVLRAAEIPVLTVK